MSLLSAILDAKKSGDVLSPQISTSSNYKHWVSVEDFKRCIKCKENHGRIWRVEELPNPMPPIHFYCRCKIENMEAITAGSATINGYNGADWKIKNEGVLPDYYIKYTEALQKGWKPKKWLSNYIPEKMIGGRIYYNQDKHLPDAAGRIWREADINYKSGRRNKQRIVWSNDGLIFVTYDHYKTFYEIK